MESESKESKKISREALHIHELVTDLYTELVNHVPCDNMCKNYISELNFEKEKIIYKIRNEDYVEKENDEKLIQEVDKIIEGMQQIMKK